MIISSGEPSGGFYNCSTNTYVNPEKPFSLYKSTMRSSQLRKKDWATSATRRQSSKVQSPAFPLSQNWVPLSEWGTTQTDDIASGPIALLYWLRRVFDRLNRLEPKLSLHNSIGLPVGKEPPSKKGKPQTLIFKDDFLHAKKISKL